MSRSVQKVSAAVYCYFEVFDSSNNPVTGLIDGDFTKLYTKDGVSLGTTVTVAEIANGRYYAVINPGTAGHYRLHIKQATYAPRGWVESFDFTTYGTDLAAGAAAGVLSNVSFKVPTAAAGVGVGSIADGAITAAAVATGAIDADALAADAVAEVQSGLATAAALATVQADTDDIQSRLPAALVGGRMDSSVGAVAAGAAVAAAVWDEAGAGHVTAGTFGARVDAAVSTRATPADVPTATANADALLDRAIGGSAGTRTLRQIARGWCSFLWGRTIGWVVGAVVHVLWKNEAGTQTVMEGDVDAAGNKSNITVDLT